MANTESVTDIYRQIGRLYRKLGADRVILLNSRGAADGQAMCLEIAVDGIIIEEMRKESRSTWPEIEIRLHDLNEEMELLDEAIEDGILL